MEFDFTVATSLNVGHDGGSIVAVTAATLNKLSQEGKNNAKKLLDVFGKRSALAQKLHGPITSFQKMSSSSEQVLFMQHNGNKALGFIKVGKRKLFIHHRGQLKEIMPLCVLDFYVHESCQRMGVGSKLFRFMLSHYNVHPKKLAYDRPSPKLIAFLRKYYKLTEYEKQNNNYVVFQQYFSSSNKPDKSNKQRQHTLSQRPLTARDRFGRKIKHNKNTQQKQQKQQLAQLQYKTRQSDNSLPGLNHRPQLALQGNHNTSVVRAAAQRSSLRKQAHGNLSPLAKYTAAAADQNRTNGISDSRSRLPSLGSQSIVGRISASENIRNLIQSARADATSINNSSFDAFEPGLKLIEEAHQKHNQLKRDSEIGHIFGRTRKLVSSKTLCDCICFH